MGRIAQRLWCTDYGDFRVGVERFVTMESDSSIASSWSSWELMDDDLSRIYIYEKEYRDYVVYFSANGDSPPSSALKSFEYSSLESS
ncbi:hypothetical protein K0M31_014412, partial [Melipona bicolor]